MSRLTSFSTSVLAEAAEAMVAVFRLHALPPLNDYLYALQPSILHQDHSALDPSFMAAAQRGRRYSAVERMQAKIMRASFGSAMDALLEELDFVMSPTVSNQPFEAGRNTPQGGGQESWIERAGFSFPINLSQQPACSVPSGMTGDALPVGLQIIGGRGRDNDVLSAALFYEKIYPEGFLLENNDWPIPLREKW